MQIPDSIWERFRSKGRDFVTQERNLRDTENTLGRVEKDAVFLELCEKSAKVLVMFLGGMTKDKDVISVGKTKW